MPVSVQIRIDNQLGIDVEVAQQVDPDGALRLVLRPRWAKTPGGVIISNARDGKIERPN